MLARRSRVADPLFPIARSVVDTLESTIDAFVTTASHVLFHVPPFLSILLGFVGAAIAYLVAFLIDYLFPAGTAMGNTGELGPAGPPPQDGPPDAPSNNSEPHNTGDAMVQDEPMPAPSPPVSGSYRFPKLNAGGHVDFVGDKFTVRYIVLE